MFDDYNHFTIGPDDEGYPELLRDLKPNPTLYGIGDPACLLGPCVSVIGARRATPYGLSIAEMAGRVAAECGLVLVSGGALGCDHAAARGALDAGGRTVVVSGCGPDVVYPPSSADIYGGAICDGGAVVSLERWGSPPARYSFPKRNNVIAALSEVLFVTEAGQRSGTMTTADAAIALGRTIYAVPGSIFSPTSSGTNKLISSGASMICDSRDLELAISLNYGVARVVAEGVPQSMGDILSALIANPMRPQELAEYLNQDLITLIKTLVEFEGKGLVRKLPDGRYSPTEDVLQGRVAPMS